MGLMDALTPVFSILKNTEGHPEPQTLRESWVSIHLQALLHNAEKLVQTLPNHARLLPVIKANAYGHGAYEVATTLWEKYGAKTIARFGVATLPEALALQSSEKPFPVLMMNMPSYQALTHDTHTKQQLQSEGVAFTVFRWEHLEWLETLASSCVHHPWHVHVKVNTGMHRLGIHWEEASAFCQKVYALHQAGVLVWEGLYTHFAMGGEPTERWLQLGRFGRLLTQLQTLSIPYPTMCHASNTDSWIALQHDRATQVPDAATMTQDTLKGLACLNVYRVGIALYGYEDEGALEALGLRPVMGVYACINQVQYVALGEGVSYDYRFKVSLNAPCGIWIGTLPLGYADGVHRQLSGQMHVQINGIMCPQVGTITMDQLMIDLSPLLQAFPETPLQSYLGTRVTLIAHDPPESQRAFHTPFPEPSLATWATQVQSIPYELMCSLNARLEKVFIPVCTRDTKES
ncbi:MAG: alanine racemase [Vampirovibrionales bacterium]